MKLKSYFSGTVEAAMELARKELGGDALLIHARPATPETRYLGAYEVVFGAPAEGDTYNGIPATSSLAPRPAVFPVLSTANPVEPVAPAPVLNGAPAVNGAAASLSAAASSVSSNPGSAKPAPASPPAPAAERSRISISAPAAGAPPAQVDRLSQDVADLKRQIERLAASFSGGHAAATATAAPPLPGLPADLDLALAQRMAQGTPLEQTFTTDSTLGRPGATRAVVALVGPPGVGKTTTLVKLAARYGLACRKPAQILTCDVFRIAAADQLRALASILGIGCDVAETPVALAQSLEEYKNKEIVFIDTPGLSLAEMEDGADLARLLASHPEVDTHLVLSASMRPADLARFADRYSVFQPKKLIFTRLDETTQYGALVSQAARLDLPISFLATGQQIPDDLEEATPRRLTDLVLGVENLRTSSIGAAA